MKKLFLLFFLTLALGLSGTFIFAQSYMPMGGFFYGGTPTQQDMNAAQQQAQQVQQMQQQFENTMKQNQQSQQQVRGQQEDIITGQQTQTQRTGEQSDKESGAPAERAETDQGKLQTQDTSTGIVEAAKKAKKIKSLSNFNQIVYLGPGVDREVYLVKTTGSGSLDIVFKKTSGSANLFKLEVGPQAVSEKAETNQVGVNTSRYHVALQGVNLEDQTAADIEEAVEDSGAALYVTSQEGAAPLSEVVELDDEVMRDLKIIVTSQSGEMAGLLEFSGDATITSVKKKEFAPQSLSAVGKIVVPLVMHELDRYFKNFPGQKSEFDTTFESHLGQTPLAHIKLQNTIARFKGMSSTTKKKLFDKTALAAVEAANGNAIPQAKMTEIKNLLQSALPPRAPYDATLSISQGTSSTLQGGATLFLKWKHKEEYVNSYIIERGLADDIEQDMDIGSFDFTPYKTMKVKKIRKGGKKKPPLLHQYSENLSVAVHSYCYRVRAVNANGSSAHSNVVCPQATSSMVSAPYNLKWTRIHSRKEADVDGLSNSDEPYLIFTMVHGKNPDGTPRVWTRRWDGADDVDTFESEPDAGQAHVTLFGKMPQSAEQDLANFRSQLAQIQMYTPGTWNLNPAYLQLLEQIRNHPWGSLSIMNDDVPAEIDLQSGLVMSFVVMEHDDGASLSLEEQIKAGITAAMDVAEAFASPDPYHVAVAVKSTLDFMYTLWANDDYVGSETWTTTYWDAWSKAPPPNGVYRKRFAILGGSEGEYNVDICMYPGIQPVSIIKEQCRLDEPY